MSDTPNDKEKKAAAPEKFIEGLDYYYEDGLFVLTAHYLRKRGYCCENGCRHCPYGFKNKQEKE